MENYTLFITSNLEKDHPFIVKLQDKGINYHASSLLNFNPIPFRNNWKAEWYFFYSKNGIQYFFDQEKHRKDKKYAVIGSASADFFEEKTGYAVDFCGTGQIEETAIKFLKLAKGEYTIFVRGKETKNSIQQILEKQMQTDELVVYDNRINTDFTNFTTKMACLTSPMNVEAFYKKCYQIENAKLFSIGPSTTAAIEALGLSVFATLAEPKIELFVEFIEKQMHL
jgi:uroporphyrinogen-III synthase